MKIVVSITLILCFCLFACKEEDSQPNWYETYYFKGIVRDSTTNKVIPGQKIFETYWDIAYGDQTPITYSDQNGVFRDVVSVNLKYDPNGSNHPTCVSSFTDTSAGFHKFSHNELKATDTLQTDIYLKPIGYLSLHIVDTSLTDRVEVTYTNVAESNSLWSYLAGAYGNADTTRLLKVFEKSQVKLNITVYKNSSSQHWIDSVYVPVHDTVFKTILF